MAQSHHAALNEGLKLYTDAMRMLVKERLIQSFPSTWWEDGALKVLPRGQTSTIRRDLEKDRDRDKADMLEPYHFPTIIGKRSAVFETVFPNHRQAQSYLMQAAEARNTLAAHSRSGDIPADDAGAAPLRDGATARHGQASGGRGGRSYPQARPPH